VTVSGVYGRVQRDMASRSVNKVILIGRLGKDAETKYTPQGVPVSRFSLATNRRWKDQQTGEWKEETDWHNIAVWRQENLANYLNKGKQIYVEGRLQTRSYEDKDGNKRSFTEVIADDVILLSSRGAQEGEEGATFENRSSPPARGAAPRPQPQPAQEPAAGFNEAITDDDVPF